MRKLDFRGSQRIERLLTEGVRDGVFPGAVALAASRGRVFFRQAVGHRSLTPRRSAMKVDTIHDLASLTKPLATGLVVMKLVDQGRLGLDQPLDAILGQTLPVDKQELTPRRLLSHSAGLPAWRPFYRRLTRVPQKDRANALRSWILEEAPAYVPGNGSLYSDLGFMLLEWIVEETTGRSLHHLASDWIYAPLFLERTFLNRRSERRFKRKEFAATEDCPWRKRVLVGETHDENAHAMGGYGGHAGLFGTAKEVFVLADMLRSHFLGERSDLFSRETVAAFLSPQVGGGFHPRALSWDMPSPRGSSSGRYFSRHSVGHLGFTGSSLWMDLERDLIVVLLSNRVHPSRNNEKIKLFRPVFHDAVVEAMDSL